MPEYRSASGSAAEDLFIDLFADTFGAEKAGYRYLYSQYPFYDIYQNARFADFVLENGATRVAIEIDDEASHNPRLVSQDKFYDDLLKQNSMIHLGWDVYRWAVRQMQKQPETVKDELRVFLGSDPRFKEIEDYLPTQQGRAMKADQLELREYQQEALDSLQAMRQNRETIALLYHATGTGKTVTAVMDAKRCGGRVLFVAHTMELVNQAYNTFRDLWPEVTVGKFADNLKEPDAHVVCGSIQSVALNLDQFREDAFAYLIIDEAHHASADTYQKVLAYFKPQFTLGLTATPERADDVNILEIFKNTAHKLDIQTAVEIGALVPVRCIRIHTNIDMTKVRFNSVQYNIRDLDVKICVTERNQLIVDTWLDYVKDKRTVVFCASVKHAEQIAELFRAAGVAAIAVSGSMKLRSAERGLGLPADGCAVHGASHHVEGAVYAAARTRHAHGGGQGSSDGLRFRGQRQPVQYALFAAPPVQTERVSRGRYGGRQEGPTRGRGRFVPQGREAGCDHRLSRGCHRLRAGGYLQLAGRSCRDDLADGVCAPGRCADRDHRALCARGEAGAGFDRAHERAPDLQVFQRGDPAGLCRAVRLEAH